MRIQQINDDRTEFQWITTVGIERRWQWTYDTITSSALLPARIGYTWRKSTRSRKVKTIQVRWSVVTVGKVRRRQGRFDYECNPSSRLNFFRGRDSRQSSATTSSLQVRDRLQQDLTTASCCVLHCTSKRTVILCFVKRLKGHAVV